MKTKQSKTISQCSSRIIIVLCAVFAATACTRQPVFPPPAVSGSDAAIDVSLLKPEIPQFFTYRHQGKNISFFVLRTDRNILSFLDACTSCFRHKRGYRYEENTLTCRFCNMKYELYRLEKGLGGCYPIKIEGRRVNDRYLIPLASLQAEAEKF